MKSDNKENAELSYSYSVGFNNSISGITQRALSAPGCSQEAIEDVLESETVWEAKKISSADKTDYLVAVGSGLLTGLLDVFFVGKFDLQEAHKWGSDKVNEFVLFLAKKDGYKKDDLQGAIKHLEESHHFAADGVTAEMGGGKQHHLRDLSHHFSIVGLTCSLFTQFTGKVIGTNVYGGIEIVPIPESHMIFIGKDVPEKIAFGTISWVFHMASDMAGSSGASTGGTGIPGPILSLIKTLSTLPIFKDATPAPLQDKDHKPGFRELVSKLFNGTLLNEKFDFRTELGIMHHLGIQSMPVIINQCIIRCFYFCRRLEREARELDIKSFNDLKRIDAKDVLPFRNKVIGRMSTIACGVFTVVDLADALIRAAIFCKGNKVVFAKEVLLRINFVGLAVFVVAISLDARTVYKEHKNRPTLSEEELFERDLAKFECLELTSEQARILQSLFNEIIREDIDAETKDRRKHLKEEWYKEWLDSVEKGLEICDIAIKDYFIPKARLYNQFLIKGKNKTRNTWPYLLAYEALSFVPYQPLNKDSNKEYKSLKPSIDYMATTFCENQSLISISDIKDFRKSFKSSANKLEGKGAQNTVKFLGTLVVTGAATGAAFVFAPYIAPIIAGKAVAGLSGAALTSASLAFVGGGALAAGGAGMAGGTAIIAGGGALLGAVGGSSASAVAAVMMDSSSYVLAEASKLYSFCNEVLIKRFNDFDSVRKIQAGINERLAQMQIEKELLITEVKDPEICNSSDKKRERKSKIKVLSKSIKYLEKCNSKLIALIPSVND